MYYVYSMVMPAHLHDNQTLLLITFCSSKVDDKVSHLAWKIVQGPNSHRNKVSNHCAHAHDKVDSVAVRQSSACIGYARIIENHVSLVVSSCAVTAINLLFSLYGVICLLASAHRALRRIVAY